MRFGRDSWNFCGIISLMRIASAVSHVTINTLHYSALFVKESQPLLLFSFYYILSCYGGKLNGGGFFVLIGSFTCHSRFPAVSESQDDVDGRNARRERTSGYFISPTLHLRPDPRVLLLRPVVCRARLPVARIFITTNLFTLERTIETLHLRRWIYSSVRKLDEWRQSGEEGAAVSGRWQWLLAHGCWLALLFRGFWFIVCSSRARDTVSEIEESETGK